MFGSGVRTGMAVTAAVLSRILLVLREAPTACAVVAVGTTMRGSAVCQSGATTRMATRTPPSACAWPFEIQLSS